MCMRERERERERRVRKDRYKSKKIQDGSKKYHFWVKGFSKKILFGEEI